MTKFLTLLAAIGLLSAPAFASPEAAKTEAVKTEAAKMEDCSKITDATKKADCIAKEAKDKAAPAAGEMKKEEKKM